MAIDYTTDIGRVRLLATDTDESNFFLFSDDQISAFLALEGGDVRLAAAQALDTISSSKALLAKKAKVGNLQLDQTSVAKDLHTRAESLRAQARSGSDPTAAVIDVIDFDPVSWWETSEE